MFFVVRDVNYLLKVHQRAGMRPAKDSGEIASRRTLGSRKRRARRLEALGDI